MTQAVWSEDDSASAVRVETGCLKPGANETLAPSQSNGRFLIDSSGTRVFKKPGSARPGDVRPLREFVASVLGHWLSLPVPRVELLLEETGPVALVREIPNYISFSHLRACGFCRPLQAAGYSTQTSLATVIVLDTWVGVGDRPDPHSNHLYNVKESIWNSIDYA